MPLAKGKSNKVVSKNIQTLVDDYQKSGRIGTSKPANKKAAVKQATAIALRTAGRPKPKAAMAKGGKVRRYATGGSINDPYNFDVAPGVSYEQQFAEDFKEKAQATAGEKSSASSGSTPSSSGASARRTPEFLPLPNQAGQAEDLMPKYKQTRMRMRYAPDAIDVTRPPPTPVRQQDQMKKGGKVSAKKRRA